MFDEPKIVVRSLLLLVCWCLLCYESFVKSFLDKEQNSLTLQIVMIHI
jgi:hypothetical protein